VTAARCLVWSRAVLHQPPRLYTGRLGVSASVVEGDGQSLQA